MNIESPRVYHSSVETTLALLEARNLTAQGNLFSSGFLKRKELLHDVSLTIRAGELVAVMGPSGAGKSTLLRLLSGHSSASGGEVILHNLSEDRVRTPGAALGHLHQDDILPSEFSLKRSLCLTGRIRNPETRPQIVGQAVESVMQTTQISHRSNMELDKLSGGERRRANLCAELLSNPLFLFLDEPTTNLDPHNSRELMQIGRDIADSGQAVVVVTHDIWNNDLYDKIAFLAEGHLIFFGAPQEALDFFGVASLGDIYRMLQEPQDDNERLRLAEAWARKWDERNIEQAQIASTPGETAQRAVEEKKLWELWNNSFTIKWSQFRILFNRSLHFWVGDWFSLLLFFGQPLVAGLLLLALADSRSLVEPVGFGLGAKQVGFTLVMIAAIMGLVNSHRDIVGERVIYRQEQMAGLAPQPYLLSKLIFLSLLSLLQVTLLLLIVMQKIEMPTEKLAGPTWLGMLIGLTLCGIANVALGLLLSSLAKTTRQAALLLVPLLTAELILGGLLFELKDPFIGLGKVLPTLWAYQALGTVVNINRFNPFLGKEDPMFTFTVPHLSESWTMLLLLVAAYAILTFAWLSFQRAWWRPRHIKMPRLTTLRWLEQGGQRSSTTHSDQTEPPTSSVP